MNGDIKVAVIGTGFGQKVHIPGFQIHHRTKVQGVYHRDAAKAKAVANEFNIAQAYSSLEDLFNSPEIDAVSIATPPFLHAEMAQQAIAAGKHVLLEKPMTLNVSEATTLYHLAQEKGIVAAMDFEYRGVPTWMRLAELLEDGYVGQKRLIKIDWLMASRANPERVWDWYAQKDKGGGALGALGSHTFDYIAWLFGPVQRMFAQLHTSISQRPDPSEGGHLKPVDADDTALLTLELADGTPCQVSISSATYGGRGHWVEVYGDAGTLILGSSNQQDYVHGFRLLGAQGGNSPVELEIPHRLAFPRSYPDGRLAPFLRTIDRWVQGIDSGVAIAPSFREGVYSQLLMDLTHESSQQQTWLDVPTLETVLR
ncbi:Gfo/Idh/MocA family protein [Sodalinema gerasimenkoae]|uniref:Gfo/Idh/MocA family protein n=1 Tax=Sodalinema gerasimenkoae TaxID=2862348 RepID=UPI0013577F56|nr:Gfo/Idh/MocA family oxidoreductase [Sodalinema gerasimenkoae]